MSEVTIESILINDTNKIQLNSLPNENDVNKIATELKQIFQQSTDEKTDLPEITRINFKQFIQQENIKPILEKITNLNKDINPNNLLLAILKCCGFRVDDKFYNIYTNDTFTNEFVEDEDIKKEQKEVNKGNVNKTFTDMVYNENRNINLNIGLFIKHPKLLEYNEYKKSLQDRFYYDEKIRYTTFEINNGSNTKEYMDTIFDFTKYIIKKPKTYHMYLVE